METRKLKAFKAYDIRGIYGRDIDGDMVYRAGFFLPGLLRAKKILVGYDCRESTPDLFSHLIQGITDSGADVYDMGLATTPMVYFATAVHGFDASVQITASHNPAEYNGLKISRSEALPVGYDTGLCELEKLVETAVRKPVDHTGEVKVLTGIREEYISFLEKFRGDYSNLKYGIDCSNGMASILVRDIFSNDPAYLFDRMDGAFPNHPPNPLDEKNTADLKKLVLENGLDAGIIFDGDADRVMFIDERGRFVRPDLITGVLGIHFLAQEDGIVLHDIRTSRGVIEFIENLGGRPFMWKVGHSHAKMKMRELKAVYGGELAGHYYFRDFFNCDSGMLAAILVLNILSDVKKRGGSFSALIDSISSYSNSGEINFRIDDKVTAMNSIRDYFTAAEIPSAFFDFDGYRVEYPEWWFNIRPSNTEPYLRLVAEADNPELLEQKLKKIREIIRNCGGTAVNGINPDRLAPA